MEIICQNYETCQRLYCGHARPHKTINEECNLLCDNEETDQNEANCKETTREIISEFVLKRLL